MKTASFSDFRKHAAELFDDVENGEIVRIFRHGRPIADISPISSETVPSWKKKPPQIPIRGTSLSSLILQERKSSAR